MTSCAIGHITPEAFEPFDVHAVDGRFCHAAVFEALDALQSGETMRFCLCLG